MDKWRKMDKWEKVLLIWFSPFWIPIVVALASVAIAFGFMTFVGIPLGMLVLPPLITYEFICANTSVLMWIMASLLYIPCWTIAGFHIYLCWVAPIREANST